MTSFIRNAALLGGLLLASASFAQDKATSTKASNVQPVNKAVQDRQAKQDAAHIMLSVEYMTQELGLSIEQVEKLKSVEEDLNARLASNEKLDPMERDANEAVMMQEYDKVLASVLTSDQKVKMEAITAKIKQQNVKTNDPIPE